MHKTGSINLAHVEASKWYSSINCEASNHQIGTPWCLRTVIDSLLSRDATPNLRSRSHVATLSLVLGLAHRESKEMWR